MHTSDHQRNQASANASGASVRAHGSHGVPCSHSAHLPHRSHWMFAIGISVCLGPLAANLFSQAQPLFPGQRRGTDIQLPTIRDRAPAAPLRSNSIEDRPSMISIGREGAVGSVAPDAPPPAATQVRALLALTQLPSKPEFPGVLILADGQRLRGELDLRSATPMWRTLWLAPRPLTVDGVRALVLDDSTPPTATENDTLQLKNGDAMTGIVTAITTTGIEIERGDGAARETVRVPFDAVRSAAFVTPPEPAIGTRIWLTDGNIIDAPEAEWMNADFLRTPGLEGLQPRQPAAFPRNSVLAIRSGPQALTALASLTPEIAPASDGAGLRYTLTAPLPRAGTWGLDAPPLELEGPVRLIYAAPPAPARLVATLTRPLGVRRTGALELVVRAGGKELARERFDAGRAHAELRIDLPAEPFEMELLAADGSAAGDLLVFERALLIPLAETTPGATGKIAPPTHPRAGSTTTPAPRE